MQSTNSSGDRWNQGQQGNPVLERVLAEIKRSHEFYYVVYGPNLFDKEQVVQKPAPGQENSTSRFDMLREIPGSFGDLLHNNDSEVVIAEVNDRFRDQRGGGDLVVVLSARHRDDKDGRYAIQLACQIKNADLSGVAEFLRRNPAALQQVMATFDKRFETGELLISRNQQVISQCLHVVDDPLTQRAEWKRGRPPRFT